jgi:predicted PurR-regulated permease PerM
MPSSARQSAIPPPAKRDATHLILVAVSLVAVAAALWLVADAIVIAFGGIVLASVLLSLSTPLARRTGLKPKWSLLIVVAGLLGLFGLLSWLFGNEMAREVAELQRRLPEAATEFVNWLNQSPAGRVIVDAIKESGANKEALTQASAMVGAVLGAGANLLLIIFLAIYFASDPSLYREGALRLVPPPRRLQLKQALDEAGVALRKWVVAQAIAMVAVGALTGAALGVMGVPLALSLGVVAGIMEFIPVIGPILAAVPAILLAFSKGPEMAFYVTLIYIAVQQIESNIITPLVQRWAVRLPPVIGLLSIVACGLLFGVLGVVFAMPIAVVVMVLVKKLYVEDTLEKRAPVVDSATGAVDSKRAPK